MTVRLGLIVIEGLARRRGVGILFSLLEKLVEFPFQYLLMTFMCLERFVEYLAAASFLALQLLDRGLHVFDGTRLGVLLIADDGLQLSVDLERRFATRAANLNQLAFAFRHTRILAQPRQGGCNRGSAAMEA